MWTTRTAGTARTAARWRRLVTAGVLALAVALVGACGSGGSGGGSAPERTTEEVEVLPEQRTSEPGGQQTDQETAQETDQGGGTGAGQDDPQAARAGEVWQWALGRDVWSDPALAPYTGDLGTDWADPDTDVHVQSEGFTLTPDASGTVVAVTVYNDETALGFPPSSSSFSAYRGALPGGLTWSDTASDLGVEYGAPEVSGGWGTSIVLSASTQDGHPLAITFLATHADDLPGSPIHSITIR
jgi:hypothetical protein